MLCERVVYEVIHGRGTVHAHKSVGYCRSPVVRSESRKNLGVIRFVTYLYVVNCGLKMAKDKYHELVSKSLENEGWTITDDPLYVNTQKRQVKIDLGAERLIGAEKGGQKIAVEIKSFINLSQVYDFYRALGQTLYYSVALEFIQSDRVLYLAIPDDIYSDFFAEPITSELVRRFSIRLIIYSVEKEKIVQWKK
jgi:hypothetical protein